MSQNTKTAKMVLGRFGPKIEGKVQTARNYLSQAPSYDPFVQNSLLWQRGSTGKKLK